MVECKELTKTDHLLFIIMLFLIIFLTTMGFLLFNVIKLENESREQALKLNYLKLEQCRGKYFEEYMKCCYNIDTNGRGFNPRECNDNFIPGVWP